MALYFWSLFMHVSLTLLGRVHTNPSTTVKEAAVTVTEQRPQVYSYGYGYTTALSGIMFVHYNTRLFMLMVAGMVAGITGRGRGRGYEHIDVGMMLCFLR